MQRHLQVNRFQSIFKAFQGCMGTLCVWSLKTELKTSLADFSACREEVYPAHCILQTSRDADRPPNTWRTTTSTQHRMPHDCAYFSTMFLSKNNSENKINKQKLPQYTAVHCVLWFHLISTLIKAQHDLERYALNSNEKRNIFVTDCSTEEIK